MLTRPKKKPKTLYSHFPFLSFPYPRDITNERSQKSSSSNKIKPKKKRERDFEFLVPCLTYLRTYYFVVANISSPIPEVQKRRDARSAPSVDTETRHQLSKYLLCFLNLDPAVSIRKKKPPM